jgi:hypothetical protein
VWLCVTSAELGSQILSKRSSPATAAEPSPGSRHSPSGDTPQIIDPNALIRIRSPAQKSLGEAFGAATGVRRPPGNADVSSAGVERRRGRRRSQRARVRHIRWGRAPEGPIGAIVSGA